jgi:hypothetical protein
VELTKTVVTLNGIYEADQSPATSCVWMVTEEIDIPLREAEVIGLVREHLGKSKSFIANRMKGIRTKNRFALINKLVDDGHLVDSCGLWLPEDFDSSKPLSPASVGYLKIPPRRKQSDRKEREAQN